MAHLRRKVARRLRSTTGPGGNGGRTRRCERRGAAHRVGRQGFQARSHVLSQRQAHQWTANDPIGVQVDAFRPDDAAAGKGRRRGGAEMRRAWDTGGGSKYQQAKEELFRTGRNV